MEFDLARLQPKERASFALRALYEAAGCRKYHMGRFEEYGLYQENRSFLSSEQVITFTDLDGRLLALKPDVTLSIAKTAQPAPGETLKYYYHENVYRPSAESHTFKEISQMGLELLGEVKEPEVRQTVCLAARSLEQMGQPWVLEISHMGYLFGLFDALGVPEAARPGLLETLRAKNIHELRAAAKAAGLSDADANALTALLSLSGEYAVALPKAAALCRNARMEAAVAELNALAEPLAKAGGSIRLDLTLAGEMEYYNGLIFQGYLRPLPRPLLKGGRYDLLMQKFTPGADAIGFAVYLDELDRLSAPLPPVRQQNADANALTALLSLSGEYAVALPKAAALCRNARMEAAVAELNALAEPLAKAGGSIRLDLTLAGEMEYYNGLIFQGYLRPLPRPLLKGGRYDLLMQKFTPGADAIGFAVYLDELDRLSAPLPPVRQQNADQGMLNVALPKGRLGDKVYDLLARIGYGCPEDYNATRKLVVENPAAGIRYFLVKPSDVAIYVEHGAADVGIVGKDILTEASADVYELLDTGLGKCRMCVAAPADYQDDPSRPVRVATKFVNVAKSYYASMGRDIDIIKLNGSIELAPILGLSDVIVDIVETGTTLRENGLKVVTEFMPVSARFIANKASYQFKHHEMERMLTKLRAALAEQEAAK